MSYIVETKKLCKNYGKVSVLNNLDVHVPKGAIYGLIGKNGAGKTTFMRLIGGLVSPTSGGYEILGVDDKTDEINNSRKKMSSIIETPSFYSELSVRENIIEQFRIRGIEDTSEADNLLKLVDLHNDAKKRARKLSFGMKQRLGIAMALVGTPELIILDEPMNGLDPQGIIDVRNIILEYNQKHGVTFIISSHLLDELSKVATDFGFIKNGEIVKEISSKEIKEISSKVTVISSNDISKLTVLLDEMSVDYAVSGDDEVSVSAVLEFDAVNEKAKQVGITIKSFDVKSESLESFYLNVMNG